jgi:ribonuclease Y
MWLGILFTLIALALGATGGILWWRQQHGQAVAEAEAEAERVRRRGRVEVDVRRHEVEALARQEILALREQHAQEIADLEARVSRGEVALAGLAAEVEVGALRLATEDQGLADREQAAQAIQDAARDRRGEAKELLAESQRQLEAQAGQTRAQCAAALTELHLEQARAEAADRIRNLETEPGPAEVRTAKRAIGISIGRLDWRSTTERQSFTVDVGPPDRMEALAGPDRENLVAIEEATGVALTANVDNGTLRVESGDGVNRVLARRVLERLLEQRQPRAVKTKRVITEAKAHLDAEIVNMGKQAFRLLSLRPAAPEITELVGRLYFRTSYTQNQWEHAVESAFLAGLMAGELGLNIKLARRAALLHDIGKALTHEVEGTHGDIGGEIARRCGEREEVIGAISGHHTEANAETSVYTVLVAAADAISGARPGARRELVETYGERIEQLEELAASFRGVVRAHAVQAGREVRVLVDERRVDDSRMGLLASEIAKQVSAELTFPGQIRITVIREFSAVEVAN